MAGLLAMPKILTRVGDYRTYLTIALGSIISLIGLSTLHSWLIIPAFILYMVLNYMIFFCLDIFIEDFSPDNETGKIRGLFLTAINLGWVFSPLLSSFIIGKVGYSGVYMTSLFLFLPIFLLILINFKNFKDPAYTKISIKENLKLISGNKNIRSIYLMNILLQFFYVGMIVYTPIYLFKYLHFSWETIGLMFIPMLSSFVILQFPLGRLSDRIGEQEMLYAGFAVMALSTVALFFLPASALAWAIGLLMTRVGAATVEVMAEVFFFKQVKVQDSRTISFFRSASPISFLIAPILMTIFLYFFPFKYIFIAIGSVMLLGLYFNYQIKDTA
jgi:MFS family permease